MGLWLLRMACGSAFGPLLPFARVRSCVASARRGGRCPAGAHAVAVGAARRLRCGARPSVASQNSLRSLRSLRSDNCDESVYEARCARRLKPSAPRRHRNRPHRVPPAALQRWVFQQRATPTPQQRRVRAGRAAPLGCREGESGGKRSGGPLAPCERPGLLARRGLQGQVSWPRAKRELSTDSSRMSERSERSERSEFCDGATRPSIAGKSERSEDRPSEAKRPARTCLCRASPRPQGGHSRSAMGREHTFPVSRFPRHGASALTSAVGPVGEPR